MENDQVIPVQPNTITPPTPTNVPIEHKPSSLPIIILSILLLISFSTIAYLYTQIQSLKNDSTNKDVITQIIVSPTPNQTATTTTVDTTINWKQINGKNWTFKVPKEWYFINCSSGNDIILGPNLSKEFRDVDIECNFGISDLLSVSRTTDEFVLPTTTSPDQNGFYTVVSNKKTIMVNNQNAIEQTEEIHGSPMEGTHTSIYIQGKNYTDTLTFWNTNINTNRELISQILSTFKFTN